MIKILHTGDIHLGSLTGPEKNGINLRREDTLRCMDEIVQTAREERPDLTIIAGDLFNRSRVWADTALDDVRDAVERLLRPLCECSGHVVLLFGTANHDNPKAFENIFTVTNDLDNLNVDTAPALYRLRCNDGSWVQIMSVPGFDKGRLRTFCPGMDKETENFNATALINDTIMGLAGRCDKSIPTIMTAHYTVAGAEADNGSTFLAGQDVVVLPATIDAAGVDLACLGHIHRPQKIACNTPAYYCGCINELTFNDEATRHGFYIHTMDGHGIVKSEFHELESSRKHYTMRIDRPQIMQFIADGTLNIAADQVYGKIVRVRYSCTSEEEKALNKAELQQKLMQMGAFYISDILPEDVEELDAKDQLTEHDGPTEALSRWLDLNNVEPWQKARLMELAAPIIAKADHGMDDGHSTGAFLPISIEVKNYRSYTDAAFSFEPVHMAMVNGANGVGKSSLFMDAIADCLYEQTRKEDIGGWVREGTKSGSIIFTFAMGEKKYRVVRTRTASGRGTLALQCFDAENQEWADGSDTTMRLTQAKIERLLGMDCNTFCSIALIRQDAYGLFLDADSDRRMEVLSALLGLDLYNRMAEITAVESKEQRRTIASAKDIKTQGVKTVEPIKTQVFRLDDIKPAPYNPRVELTAKDREFKALTASIEQHGLVQPLIVNIRDGYLIGGHQRLNVLKAAGETETEAVVVDLDEAHAKALCLALNKLDGEWDYGILYDIMNELRDAGADTLSTGFTDREIDDLIGKIGQEIDEEEDADIEANERKADDSDEIKCYAEA